MDDFKLSEHFSFFEMTDSTSHPEDVEKNRADALHYLESAKNLCENILEPLRAWCLQQGIISLPEGMKVDSGFRDDTLNGDVHGSPTSQHRLFQAADILPNATMHQRLSAAQWMKGSGIKFGQALVEGSCLHVSLPGATHFCQINNAKYVDGKWQLS